jgi:hypothetical protein
MNGLPITEFAALSGISRHWAGWLVKSGKVPATKNDRGVWIIPRTALEAYQKSRELRQRSKDVLGAVSS